MSANRTRIQGKRIALTITDGGVAAGDPALVGAALTGVVENPKDANNLAVLVREGIFSLSVKGIDQGGNSAVAQGDKIFYVSGDTPKLSKKNTGVFFGYAKGTVNSAATATIEVIVDGGSAS